MYITLPQMLRMDWIIKIIVFQVKKMIIQTQGKQVYLLLEIWIIEIKIIPHLKEKSNLKIKTKIYLHHLMKNKKVMNKKTAVLYKQDCKLIILGIHKYNSSNSQSQVDLERIDIQIKWKIDYYKEVSNYKDKHYKIIIIKWIKIKMALFFHNNKINYLHSHCKMHSWWWLECSNRIIYKLKD